MVSEVVSKFPLQETSATSRITCCSCGKLLFKLTRNDPEEPAPVNSHQIEIKCHNRQCKYINTIMI